MIKSQIYTWLRIKFFQRYPSTILWMPKQSFKDNESRIEISTSMTLSYDLHDPIDIFLKSRLTTLDKGIHCSCKSRATRCNLWLLLAMVSKISAIDTKSRVELYVVQSLYCPEKLRVKLQRGCVTHYSLRATCLETLLRHILQRKLHRVTLALCLVSVRSWLDSEIVRSKEVLGPIPFETFLEEE